jgi:hypothetical protein
VLGIDPAIHDEVQQGTLAVDFSWWRFILDGWVKPEHDRRRRSNKSID